MALRTLLIGLGGTGCQIVDRAAAMIGDSRVPDHSIQCIGFDTDSNDLSQLKNIDIIPTSKEQTVDQYLRNTKGWQEWFPDNALIKRHNMINGAGQMRPLSRLAFTESIASSRIGVLKDAIKKLNLARGQVEPSNMRVMIVSSFAGGTGSGMFIQTAMWIRRYFREEYGGEVLMRGLFALPDMFMPSTDDEIQKESKYANAYGAVRELNAINEVSLSASDKADRIKIEIEGFYDSEKQRKSGSIPFDLLFFIDDLNKVQRKLPDLESYKELMAKITYLQVYSPLTVRQDTVEDNRLITLMQSGYRALYGSAGASSLKYPYKDIVRYCSLRAASEAIGQSWTFFDDEFGKAFSENQDQRRADPSVPLLRRDEFFVRAVSDRIKEGAGQFKFIKTQIQDESDGMNINREETYFANIMSLISSKSEFNEKLDLTRANCDVNLQNLRDPDEVRNEVSKTESALKTYQQQIEDSIAMDKSSLIQSVICDSPDSVRSFNGGEYNILNLLKKESSTVHPLSARLLLYRLRVLVREGLAAAENELATCITENSDYKNHDFNRKLKGIQDAHAEASRVSQLPVAKFHPAFHAFRNEYARKARNQLSNLDAYRESSLQKAVLSEVLNRLNILTEKYEVFFSSLPKIREKIIADVRNLENAHTSETDLTTYVYAGPENKRSLYSRLSINTSSEENSTVNEAITQAMYKEACTELEDQLNISRRSGTDEEESERTFRKMEDIFSASILKRTAEETEKTNSTLLDINAYEALMQQCAESGGTPGRILSEVAQKGAPYLLYNDQKEIDLSDDSSVSDSSRNGNFVYSMVFWGISPDVEKSVISANPELDGSAAGCFKVDILENTPYVEVKERFSKYEIECYRSVYGISLSDIDKFTETGERFGSFYRYYNARLNKMLADSDLSSTPHLDIRWHLPSYLPYINSAKGSEDDARGAEAFWLALAYGAVRLRRDSSGTLRFVSVLDNELGSVMEWDGRRLGAEDTYELLLALKNDEKAVRRALEYKNNEFESEKRSARGGKTDDKKFILGLISSDVPQQNAVTVMCCAASSPQSPAEEFKSLKTALENLIAEFCSNTFSDSEEKEALCAKIKKQIAEASSAASKPKDSNEYQWFSDWM